MHPPFPISVKFGCRLAAETVWAGVDMVPVVRKPLLEILMVLKGHKTLESYGSQRHRTKKMMHGGFHCPWLFEAANSKASEYP